MRPSALAVPSSALGMRLLWRNIFGSCMRVSAGVLPPSCAVLRRATWEKSSWVRDYLVMRFWRSVPIPCAHVGNTNELHPYGTDPVFMSGSRLYDPGLIDRESGDQTPR